MYKNIINVNLLHLKLRGFETFKKNISHLKNHLNTKKLINLKLQRLSWIHTHKCNFISLLVSDLRNVAALNWIEIKLTIYIHFYFFSIFLILISIIDMQIVGDNFCIINEWVNENWNDLRCKYEINMQMEVKNKRQ